VAVVAITVVVVVLVSTAKRSLMYTMFMHDIDVARFISCFRLIRSISSVYKNAWTKVPM
jgi:hypothetical protein